MKKGPSLLFVILSVLLSSLSQAQDISNRILMTIDGRNVEAGEFIRMYNKSKDPSNVLNVDEYLNQFILFKLKVTDAIRMRLDTTRAFKTELKGYRTQLAQTYLTDSQTKEKLLKQAYQRSLNEVCAWHILIGLSPDAAPADTLAAWKKASDVRERIIKGESFEEVARGASDDKSVLVNGGNLGYFTTFQMIMPFEDAAYSLKKGEISKPVRTPYGYHIIKVTDKRPARGRVKVAHIMKAIAPGAAETEVSKAEQEIKSIYAKLKAGESFSEMAKKFSDHKESAPSGGQLDWFGTGEIISSFSEAAFLLRDTGDYTEPVRTPYGWHIIKLLDRQKPRSFEESRSYLESRLNQSYLNSLSKKSFVEKLKKNYSFSVVPDAYSWFVNNTDTLIIRGMKKYDRSTMPDGNIYSFAKQLTTTKRFADFIEKGGFMVSTNDSRGFINSMIDLISSDQLIKYEDSQLERKYADFRYLMNEFHDGILLFEISSQKVWNRVSDSTGLKEYYEKNKQKYLSKEGIDVKIYTLKKKGGDKALAAAFNKFSVKKDKDLLLKKKFNRKNDTLLAVSERRWFRGDDPQLDSLKWARGNYFVRRDGWPAVIEIRELIEPVPLELEKVQEEMMTGYQDYLESSWTEQLKKKYTVKIDNLVLAEVKKKLDDE